MRNAIRLIHNRHGAALALVAVSLVVILGMGALAVDMGMLIKQREDAQRSADAAALAGASAFQEGEALTVLDIARDRAFNYLAKNYVGQTYIDTTGKVTTAFGSVRVTTSAEGTVIVLPDSEKVRVIVRRPAVGTLFARVLGIFNVDIAAKAAAVATTSGGASCLMPFAIPDAWDEQSVGEEKDQGKTYTGDTNGNRIQDGDEHWAFDRGTDRYDAYDPDDVGGLSMQTGYGSDWRGTSADYGREVLLKPQSPQTGAGGPGNFYLWNFSDDQGGNGRGCDSTCIFDRITSCYPKTVFLGQGDSYVYYDSTNTDVTPGNSKSVRAAVGELISRDPGAHWDPTSNEIIGSSQPDWRNSPRVVKVAMFNPWQLADLANNQPIVFGNIAMFFIEGADDKNDDISGRFLYYANGGPTSGPTTGSLIKTLRLVE
jgi:Flp pilus assembly protein TadG